MAKTVVQPKPAVMAGGASEENKDNPMEVREEPAVMAAGASPENAEEGKGGPAKDLAQADPKALKPEAPKADAEGYRDDKGHFTGNPPTTEERVDAICDLLESNGWTLPKILQR
jgi:hypothetical protein